MYLIKMQVFQRYNISSAYKIAGGADPFASSGSMNGTKKIRSEFTSKIAKNFLDALYAFLDGLVQLASDDWGTSKMSPILAVQASRVNGPEMGIDLSNTVCILSVGRIIFLMAVLFGSKLGCYSFCQI